MSYDLGLSTSCEGEPYPCGASGTLASKKESRDIIASTYLAPPGADKRLLLYGSAGLVVLLMLVFRR